MDSSDRVSHAILNRKINSVVAAIKGVIRGHKFKKKYHEAKTVPMKVSSITLREHKAFSVNNYIV